MFFFCFLLSIIDRLVTGFAFIDRLSFSRLIWPVPHTHTHTHTHTHKEEPVPIGRRPTQPPPTFHGLRLIGPRSMERCRRSISFRFRSKIKNGFFFKSFLFDPVFIRFDWKTLEAATSSLHLFFFVCFFFCLLQTPPPSRFHSTGMSGKSTDLKRQKKNLHWRKYIFLNIYIKKKGKHAFGRRQKTKWNEKRKKNEDVRPFFRRRFCFFLFHFVCVTQISGRTKKKIKNKKKRNPSTRQNKKSIPTQKKKIRRSPPLSSLVFRTGAKDFFFFVFFFSFSFFF